MFEGWWRPFFFDALRWWAIVTALGWLAWPMAYRLASLSDERGLGLSKLLGLAATAWIAAWAAYLGMPGPRAIHTALGVMTIANVAMLAMSWRWMWGFLRRRFRRVMALEAFFAVAYVAFLWMRSWFADATYDAYGWWGAEKWVNLGLLTGLWRDFAAPPIDPWLAGRPVNYYFLSHLVWAMTARLSGVAPPVAFNLGLATLFALLLNAARAAGRAVSGDRPAAGRWAVFLVAVAGPPAAWGQVGRVVRALGRSGWASAMRAFDFWAPSDVVADTRNEFPAFNWLLGDLHAHALGLVLLLAAVCLLDQLRRAREAENCAWRIAVWRQPAAWALAALSGAMWATNGWDVAVLAAAGALWAWGASMSAPRACGGRGALVVQGWLLGAVGLAIGVGFLAGFYTEHAHLPLEVRHPWLAALPGPLAALGGVGLVEPRQWTTPADFLRYWGLFPGAALAWRFARGPCRGARVGKRPVGRGGWNSPWVAGALGLLAVFVLVKHGGAGVPWVGAGSLAFGLWCAVRLGRSGRADSDARRWALVLGGAAAFCVGAAEFFFADDPIGPPYDRYNTVFKLWYASWALAALAVAALVGEGRPSPADAPALEADPAFDPLGGMADAPASGVEPEPEPPGAQAPRRRVASVGFAVLVVVAGGLYSVLGIASRIQEGRARIARWQRAGYDAALVRAAGRTLDATAFLAMPDEAPDDLRLGLWMRQHLRGPGYLAEAPGASYTLAGRFAVLSGVPCVLGWDSHETQWRGEGFSLSDWQTRMLILENVYESGDPAAVRSACRLAGIRWVAAGSLERARYGEAGLGALAEAGSELVRFGDAVVYEVAAPEDFASAGASSSSAASGSSPR